VSPNAGISLSVVQDLGFLIGDVTCSTRLGVSPRDETGSTRLRVSPRVETRIGKDTRGALMRVPT
jgi:hypothetical protein